ncbi:MAG TPA: flagellar biosynthesis protein FliQ [Burkholderiaceae bacterium]|nr:flagellar biosynthesis protein FliQ [Burkholderiaceae bacterium]
MTAETVMSMTYQALLVALGMAAPLLLVTLAIGLLVSVVQAATQINEMTLSFIPKLLGLGIALVVFGPWLIANMVNYMQTLFSSLPTLAN